MDEKQFVLDSFDKNFEALKNTNIVIYGLGKNTKLILDERKQYRIVGLMDGVRTGEVVWGLPVITCDEANDLGVSAIIIIATAANVPLIYQRIAAECEMYHIQVFDINGNEQKRLSGEYKLPEIYSTMTKDALLSKINGCDVISFDIFDTLLVRRVLQPTDLFENLMNKYEFYHPDFCRKRISCERELYNSTNPNIYEIYSSMAKEGILGEDEIDKYVELEIEEEQKVLLARNEMVDVLNYAKKKGKIICCTSDMYIPGKFLKNILVKKGIHGIDEIFVSCDYGKSKCNGLYEVLKEKFPEKVIIHIGDNYDADIICAERYGIQDTFRISSIYQMVIDSQISNILNCAISLADRNAIGPYVAHAFNNPFLFANTSGKVQIESCYELGYYYIEPIIEVFLLWMLNTAENENVQQLLLGSRDGWLIKELLDIYQEKEILAFEYEYFYASRAACTMSGIQTNEDIRYAASLAFDGPLELMLSKRFLLDLKDIHMRKDCEDDEQYLARHYSAILKKVDACKSNYIKYASNIIKKEKRIGFFDFVSSGTCQLWLEKIIGTTMNGLYFARNYDEYKSHLRVNSLLKPAFVYEKPSKLYKDYVFLENILTSPEPTLSGFDDNGSPMFVAETRGAEQLSQLDEIHKGIKEAFSTRLKDADLMSNIKIAEEIMDYVRPEYSIIRFDFFKENSLKDEFCNRIFDLQLVLENSE